MQHSSRDSCNNFCKIAHFKYKFSLIPQEVKVREFMCCVASFGRMAAATNIHNNLDLIIYMLS